MSKQVKRTFNFYSAWNYKKEIEDLNRESERGWQLVKGGCFNQQFEKNEQIRYRYQLDFRKIDNVGRYIETFREQGWEYINSTFNGWHYFRKLYDPSLPEDEYEIFTDRESIQEMNGRWARFALALSIILGLFAILNLVRYIRQPHLPVLVQLLTLAIESLFLLRGVFIMRNPDSSRSRRGDSAMVGLFFAVIIVGAVLGIILTEQRPYLETSQQASSIDAPVRDSRWADFKISYKDNYFLDLELKGEEPVTLQILNDKGEVFFAETSSNLKKEDIPVRLPRGSYCLSMSCDAGYLVDVDLE